MMVIQAVVGDPRGTTFLLLLRTSPSPCLLPVISSCFNHSQVDHDKMSLSRGSSTMALNSESILDLTQFSSTETTSAGSGGSTSRSSWPKAEESTNPSNISTLGNSDALQMLFSSKPVWEWGQQWGQDNIGNIGTSLSVNSVALRRPSSKKPKRVWAQSWEFQDFQNEHGSDFSGFVGSDNLKETTEEDLPDIEILSQDSYGKINEYFNRMSSFASQVASFRGSPSLPQTQSSPSDEAIATPTATIEVIVSNQSGKRKRSRSNPKTETDDQIGARLKRRRSRFGESVEDGAGLVDAKSTNVSLDEVIATRKIYPTPHKNFQRGWQLPSDDLPITDLRQRIQWKRSIQNQIPPIIIDGSNVAYSYGELVGGSKRLFASMGILVCVNHFANLGCQNIYVIVPRAKLHDPSVQDGHILRDLNKEGRLWTTWSRRLGNGKWVSTYDDRDILDLATKKDGVIISNDKFRDLWPRNLRWRYVIENRVFQFNFVADNPNEIRFPLDPLEWSGCPSFVRGIA